MGHKYLSGFLPAECEERDNSLQVLNIGTQGNKPVGKVYFDEVHIVSLQVLAANRMFNIILFSANYI